MSIRRLFCSRRRIEDGVFTISGEEAHHGLKVLRLRQGDDVFIFTEQGSEFLCSVLSTSKNQFKAQIVEKLGNTVESPLTINLIQGMPKAAKLEQIIVHSTELGLDRMYPVITERSIKTGERRERWRRLALEATKQSGRRAIPFIEPITHLEKLDFQAFDNGLKLVAVEPPEGGSLDDILQAHPRCSEVTVTIGPEGGFTGEEIDFLIDKSFLPFTIGPRILRTQTASLAIFAILQFELGDWTAGTARI